MTGSNIDHSEEFARLLSECEKQLFSYILSLVWNVQDAEDLYQQTAMTLWSKFQNYESRTDFSHWAFATARLLISNFQRTRRRYRKFLTPDLAVLLANKQGNAPTNEYDSLADALIECTNRLSESDRNLLELCYSENHTIKEIAKRIGRPVQSIYNALSRIRRSLFDCIRHMPDQKVDL